MKIKTGDKVKIMVGKDRGKEAKVLQVFPKFDKIVVEGLNVRVKHLRARAAGQKGQKIEFPSPLEVANVALVCPKCNAAARIGYHMSQDEKGVRTKSRVCKKCKAVI